MKGKVKMNDKLKSNPMAMMLAMAIDTSMASTSKIQELMNKYKASGVDVIPISELEQCISSSVEHATSEKGLLNSILND